MKAPFEFGFIYDPSQRDLKGLLYKNFSLLPKKLISWDKSFLGCFFISREKELYPLIICNKRWKLCRNLHGLLRSLWKTNVCKVFQRIYIYIYIHIYIFIYICVCIHIYITNLKDKIKYRILEQRICKIKLL